MDEPHEHKGYYVRKLPHIDSPGLVQSVTFRLKDSLPRQVMDDLGERLEFSEDEKIRAIRERYLNKGYGECHLHDPRIAEVVQNALLHFDKERYDLYAWVIMPNHVHVIFQTFVKYPLYDVVSSWKGFTAYKANRILGGSGRFWAREYFDRYIRNDRHLDRAVNYVHSNPTAAGLVEHCEDWPYSSFRLYYPE